MCDKDEICHRLVNISCWCYEDKHFSKLKGDAFRGSPLHVPPPPSSKISQMEHEMTLGGDQRLYKKTLPLRHPSGF